jgi:hypothetical protein
VGACGWLHGGRHKCLHVGVCKWMGGYEWAHMDECIWASRLTAAVRGMSTRWVLVGWVHVGACACGRVDARGQYMWVQDWQQL